MKINRDVFEKAIHLKNSPFTQLGYMGSVNRIIHCYHRDQHVSIDTVRVVEKEYKLVIEEEKKNA
jgi:hypothetical protein